MRRAVGLLILCTCGPLLGQQLPRLGANIGWSFVFTCPANDTTCAPFVEYASVPAYAYTDRQGNRTPFANWVRDTALRDLKAKGMSFVRMFFSPGTDVGCQGCGFSGAAIGHRPFLLPRGNPYTSGKSFATRSQPQMQAWVYSNMRLFFQDVAAAGLEMDFSLHYDENYAYFASNPGEGGFVGYEALREAWLSAATALVDSGVTILQLEPSQEEQLFQTSVETHPVSLEYTPGMIQSRVIAPGTWGDKSKGQYGVEMLDATVGPLQQRFPQIAGRIYPGLELRGAAGACNVNTLNNWGNGPWTTTDTQSYYAWAVSRNLVLPWTINIHRYVGLDLNSNFAESVEQVRQAFNDLYAFHSGDRAAASTRCENQPVSPAAFSAPPLLIFGETNSDAVIDWAGLQVMTAGYQQSRLAQWLGGGYRQTILMPWFFGHGANPFDPENVSSNLHPQ